MGCPDYGDPALEGVEEGFEDGAESWEAGGDYDCRGWGGVSGGWV